MRKLLAGLAVALSLAVAATATAPATASAACYEGQSCWSWSTMGNGLRGVYTVWGSYDIVNAYQFCFLNRVGYINWAITPRLHGDGYAFTTC